MSWADVDNDNAEMEENPNPEEDSDLPHWHRHDGERLEFRGEEDGPEDDLAIAQGAVNFTDTRSSPTDELLDVRLIETVDSRVDSTVCGCDDDLRNNSLPSIQLTGQTESSLACSIISMADIAHDGDSFEQDEETATPESENYVRNNAYSESDRQLFQLDGVISNQCGHGTELLQNTSCDLHTPRHPDSENASQALASASELIEDVVNSDPNLQQNVDVCTFRGDVEVAISLEDATEAEIGDLKQEGDTFSYEEEDNFSLFTNQAFLENSQHTMSASNLNEQSEVTDTDFDVRIVANISRNENSEIVIHEGIAHHLQAPECDREAISYLQTCIDSHQQIHIAHTTELMNSLQAQCDNNAGDPQPTEQDASEGQIFISNDFVQSTSELEPADDKNLSSINPVNAESYDTPTFCVSEVLPGASEAGQDEISNGQESAIHSGSLLQNDDFSAQFTDTGLRQCSNGDYTNQQLFPTISQHDQPISATSQSHSANSTTSISFQQNDDSEHPEDAKLKNNFDLNSSHLLAHVVQEIRDSCSLKTNINSQLQLSDSNSQNSAAEASQHSSPVQCQLQTVVMESNHLEKALDLALQSDDEDDLLHELDVELLSHTTRIKSPRSYHDPLSGISDKRNLEQTANGMQPLFDVRHIQEHNRQLLEQLRIRDDEIERLTDERDSVKQSLAQAHSQVEDLQKLQKQNTDIYLPQIKTLENTVAQQQDEMKTLKEKLVSHDSAAKRAVTTLQHELKSRVEQITKMYEDCLKEKDMMVIKFAESETKNMEAKRMAEKIDAKLKETMKDKDNLTSAFKIAKSDKLKAVSNFELKCAEVSNLQKELEKLKEAINSSEYRIKWFQNKLKDELEGHKETKSSLEKTSIKLKEAREETEIIRKECHSIVKRYQESEEIKSNSLDKELKLKESELRTQLQERNDTEEVHQMTKRELESLKSQHKDIVEEVKTYKHKVHCLEEERKQNHHMIENHQEIMQRQKADNADLKARVASLSNLEEDYKRAQDMIQTLDKDIAELKIQNRDFLKDMESCRERECKMLTLQSELSCTNAVLRSENTNLSNKASMLTGEVEKCKMEIQELETTVKDLGDKYEEEKTKRKEEAEKIGSTLAEKMKECNELKQKWEDEIDSNRTLKRRHANNIKDLTRQLQQVRKRLDTMEGKGDAGSMGSRTNSNGSLNSIENSLQQSATIHQPPVQEFPVITEQVEVDKQVLIERIVRLQKSHARKNDKLEFLGEHIQQLLDEIRKKNKIIQCYALREESGTLSSEDMDANKTLLARKGGIMASVYTVHQQDGSMTLELSLQINQKLQAVLEDTLLKNITLKESLDTLGAEIARLSQENRRLQLNLQEIEGRLT